LSPPLIARRRLLALGAALGLAAPALAAPPRQDPRSCRGQAEIKPLERLEVVTPKGRTKFQVELADSPREREFGLMCRKSLAADRGMLFDFGQPQDLAFWMRNTLISLDIIYIRADGRVLSIVRNARPLDESPLPSGGPARAALELAAGRAAELGLLPGDRVFHRIFPRD
jgi:uncharacterized protein